MKTFLIASTAIAAFALAPAAFAQVPGSALPEAPPEQIEPADPSAPVDPSEPMPPESPSNLTPEATATPEPQQTAAAASEAKVFFATGSAQVDSDHESKLASAAEGWSGGQVIVTGFADQSGDADVNMALSERRSEAVKQLLINHGVEADAISIKAMGETAANGEGEEERRVEVAFLSEADQAETP
jgi:OOP family OmpA-OmpF porin